MPTEPKNNFDVLIRILDNRGTDGTVMSGPEDDDVSSVLTDQVSQQINQGGRKGGRGQGAPHLWNKFLLEDVFQQIYVTH